MSQISLPSSDFHCSFFNNAASVDYNSISGEEIVFTSGQTVNDIQCTPITILDNGNVLENTESFQVTMSAADPFIRFLPMQDSIVVNINEDPLDGSLVIIVISYIQQEWIRETKGVSNSSIHIYVCLPVKALFEVQSTPTQILF